MTFVREAKNVGGFERGVNVSIQISFSIPGGGAFTS